jgi:predicted nucleotidyltransferase
LKKAARLLKTRCPAVEAVYLFGSFASGIPTPKSDADLLVVAEEKDSDAIREIIYSAPVPIDLFVVSPNAFSHNVKAGKGIAALAVRKGVKLL